MDSLLGCGVWFVEVQVMRVSIWLLFGLVFMGFFFSKYGLIYNGYVFGDDQVILLI